MFNALPWTRGGVVETVLSGAPPRALRDADTGTLVPVDFEGGKIRFLAQDVPSLGYRTYAFGERAAPAKSGLDSDEKRRTIENQYFRVTLDPAAGRIASLLDKASGRELVDTRAEAGFGQYVHEQFDADDMTRFIKTYTKPTNNAIWGDFGKPGMPPAGEWPHRTASPRDLALRLTRGPVSVSAVMEASPSRESPYRTALAVTLYDSQPYVEINWRVADKAATPFPEGGWLAFPLNVASPRFRLARLGAVIDPASDTVRGANHDVYCVNGGVAVLDAKEAGVGLCPLG